MGAASLHEIEGVDGITPGDRSHGTALVVAPGSVEVRRHAGVAAGVGLVACAVAIAYLARATQSGSAVDWIFAGVMGALGGFWLAGFLDARTPLFVADAQGVRIRLGRTWRGLPWSAVHHVEVTPRRGLLRDGRLVVVPRNPELVEADLDGVGRRHTALARRLYGSVLAVPLGISTRVIGGGNDLAGSLEAAAGGATPVELTSAPSAADELDDLADLGTGNADDAGHHVPDPRPRFAAWISRLAARVPLRERAPVPVTATDAAYAPDTAAADDLVDAVDAVEAPRGGSSTPLPLRDPSQARRTEVRREVLVTDVDVEGDRDAPSGRELRRPGSVNLVEDTQAWGDRVRPLARAGESVEPLVIDEFALEPAEDPVIGPEIAAARTRLGLDVDQLADRTRIRPHVIESIEVDDFVPCGGDFYARGHLRTLARILGIDATPLLASYDERYAHAPIDARRVFEAELATGTNGSIRGTRGGPNWSVLVAVVMALVLCWSIARLVMDTPAELRNNSPVLNGSGGPDGAGASTLADPVTVQVSAPAGGAHVVVRDGSGEIVFKGGLAVGDVRDFKASPPVRVQSSDGAVTVALAGGGSRPVGEPGSAGQGTFVVN